MRDICLKSIGEILKENYSFYIPAYQRGYRWDKENVSKLLDDLEEFRKNEKNMIITVCNH